MTWPLAPLQRAAYRVILADPPWKFAAGPSRNPSRHYACMPLDEIKALPVGALAHPEGCRLFLWTTMPFLERSFEVLRAWRFRYSTARVWCKLWPKEDGAILFPDSFARGTGYEVIGNAEILLIAKRGRPRPPRGRKPSSLIFAQRREHSRKPDLVRDELATLFEGPRCELFARSTRPGWDAWGNETDKFGEAA